jgi:hypothetical protein
VEVARPQRTQRLLSPSLEQKLKVQTQKQKMNQMTFSTDGNYDLLSMKIISPDDSQDDFRRSFQSNMLVKPGP